ncbi:peroxisomal ATPase PEX6 isoform 1-T1 [Menidia menidia]
MALLVEVSCLERFPPQFNPLEVLVLKSHLQSVFQTETDPPAVLLFPEQPRLSEQRGILLRLHPTTEAEIAGCGGGNFSTANGECPHRVPFFTSESFFRHHRLSLPKCSGTARPFEPVGLDRVVLGGRSIESLHWARGERFTGELLELCRSGQRLLAREGDPLLLPKQPLDGGDQGQVLGSVSEFVVLECSPATQGRITADTSLVLTECWDSADHFAPPLSYRLPRLCVSDFAHYACGLGGGQPLLDNGRLLASGFSNVLGALECRPDVRVVDTRQWRRVRDGQGATVDGDNCVFVSKQLLLKLGLFNHEWVRLSKLDGSTRAHAERTDGQLAVSRKRLTRVVVVDPSLSAQLQDHEDVGFISATLWFNMTEGEMIPVQSCTLRMKRWKPSPPDPHHQGSESFCRTVAPPFAGQLHIQPVVSPQYNHLGCYDTLLVEHFSHPRVVSLGDILTVPTENHPDLLENSSEGLHRCPVLYFRVNKVCLSAKTEEQADGGAYLADRVHTTLYMESSTKSPVPCHSSEGVSLWSSLSPPGLHKTVDRITSILLPHIQHSSSLSGCTILLYGPAGSGKRTVARAASHRLNLHLLKVDCVTLCADTPAACEVKLMSVFQRAETFKPCILLLRNLQLLLRARAAAEDDGRVQAVMCQQLRSIPHSVLVIATVCRPQELSAGVTGVFVHQVELENPTEEQRHSMLVSLSRELPLGRDVNLERISKLSSGSVLGDLSALVVETGRAACRRLIHTCDGRSQEDLCSSGVTILNQDFSSALENLQKAQAKAIGAPKIPNVHWEDVGGLQHVKKEILDTIQLPLQHPELFTLGVNRTGVLLYGPPGTGKTLLAKAVATECSMTFLSIKGPELINMYVGQSEENIREVFHRARSAAPCVVFFDELDSLAPNRGRSGDSGGVMDRVVSQLLAELDTLHSSAGVFVIGATNRPDLLDQSLLRPGRFDKLVYVGINEDRLTQLQVLQAILRKFHLEPSINLQEVVHRCPTQMTGADLYALCSDAMTTAIKRKISLISDSLDSEESPVLLSMDDFSTALENFKPSLSNQELLRYENIQQKLTAK